MLNKDNLKTTWKLIGMIVNRKGSSYTTINKLIIDNKCFTDKQNICDQLNTYYINVGKT